MFRRPRQPVTAEGLGADEPIAIPHRTQFGKPVYFSGFDVPEMRTAATTFKPGIAILAPTLPEAIQDVATFGSRVGQKSGLYEQYTSFKEAATSGKLEELATKTIPNTQNTMKALQTEANAAINEISELAGVDASAMITQGISLAGSALMFYNPVTALPFLAFSLATMLSGPGKAKQQRFDYLVARLKYLAQKHNHLSKFLDDRIHEYDTLLAMAKEGPEKIAVKAVGFAGSKLPAAGSGLTPDIRVQYTTHLPGPIVATFEKTDPSTIKPVTAKQMVYGGLLGLDQEQQVNPLFAIGAITLAVVVYNLALKGVFRLPIGK